MPFRRGLSEPFIKALKRLADPKGASWWRDILKDITLLIGIRDEYLNVYWQGRAIFTVYYEGGRVKASTHQKYLLDPGLSDQVSFDVESSSFGQLPPHALQTKYEGDKTLKKLKKAASLFSGDEQAGVHTIVCNNANVVDVEITISTNGEEGDSNLPRIDIAAFEKRKSEVALVFWEAKLFANKDLRAKKGDAPVVGQINYYKRVIEQHYDEVLNSYKVVASNIVAIAKMSEGARQVSSTIEAVARDGTLTLSKPPSVGLLIFGYDDDQRTGGIWTPHLNKLNTSVGLVRPLGKAKSVRL